MCSFEAIRTVNRLRIAFSSFFLVELHRGLVVESPSIFLLSWFMVFKLSLNVIWITEQLEMCQYIFFLAPFIRSAVQFSSLFYPTRETFAPSHTNSVDALFYSYLEHRFIWENMFYIKRKRRMNKKKPPVWLSFQWFQIHFREELVMVHDDVHTAILNQCNHWICYLSWLICVCTVRIIGKRPFSAIQLVIRRFNSHYQCHLYFGVPGVCPSLPQLSGHHSKMAF